MYSLILYLCSLYATTLITYTLFTVCLLCARCGRSLFFLSVYARRNVKEFVCFAVSVVLLLLLLLDKDGARATVIVCVKSTHNIIIIYPSNHSSNHPRFARDHGREYAQRFARVFRVPGSAGHHVQSVAVSAYILPEMLGEYRQQSQDVALSGMSYSDRCPYR